jgi:hypothetical protein
VCCALLGGGGGGLRSGAVGGAQRSGPPLRGVDGGAQPAEPRVRPVVIVIGAPSIERGAGVRDVARAFIPRVVPFKPCLPREFLGRAEDNGWVAPKSLTSHQAFERRGNRNSYK